MVVASVKRVVFVTYYYSPYVSGLTLCTRALAEGLASRGWDVHVVCGHHDSAGPARESIGGVRVHRLRTVGGIDKGIIVPGLVPAALRQAGRHGILVPVLPLVEAAAISHARPRNRVVPFYVCDLRLGDAPSARAIERLAHASARRAVRRSVAYTALSEEYARASRVIGEIERPVVGVLPPVHPGRFGPADSTSLRMRLGLPPQAPLVGFVGRLVPEKGIPVLMEAVGRLRAERPDVRLVIAGDGDTIAGGGLGAELRARGTDDGSVIFTGFMPDLDLPSFYSMLDVLALPSIDPLEAYGMVQVEAMLCGTPVVASDMPGVRIPVTRTGMGVLVRPGDAAALALALGTVLDAPEHYAVPRAVVERELSPDEGVTALASLLEILSDRPAGPGPE
jgi:glycosyltransferase involved in cell wall biosynthesis